MVSWNFISYVLAMFFIFFFHLAAVTKGTVIDDYHANFDANEQQAQYHVPMSHETYLPDKVIDPVV